MFIPVEYYKDTDGLSTTASTIYRNVAVSSEEAGRSAKWDEFLEIFYLIAHDGYFIPNCKSRQNQIDGALEIYRCVYKLSSMGHLIWFIICES